MIIGGGIGGGIEGFICCDGDIGGGGDGGGGFGGVDVMYVY